MAYTSSVGTSPTASPQGEAFWEGCPAQLLLIIASDFSVQSTLLRHADAIGAGRAQHDQGGKQKANGGKLAFIRAVQAFTCHGRGWAAVLPSSFISAAFASATQALCFFLDSRKKRPFSSAFFFKRRTGHRCINMTRITNDGCSIQEQPPFCFDYLRCKSALDAAAGYAAQNLLAGEQKQQDHWQYHYGGGSHDQFLLRTGLGGECIQAKG